MACTIAWQEGSRPIDWAGEFGRRAPLEVEIGFGRSRYLVRQAQARPEHDFVGIEAEYGRVAAMERRLRQSGPFNIRLIRADAWVALERLFRPRSVLRTYSLFPDPWPKPRHIHNRLFSNSFLKLLNSRLLDNGRALVVTDDGSYAQWICQQAPKSGFQFDHRLTKPCYGTEFERLWRSEGKQRFHEVRFLKRRHIELPLIEDINLQEHRLERFDFENFQMRNLRGKTVVQFKALKHYPETELGKVIAVVADGRLLQHVWIDICRQEGVWKICLDSSRAKGIVPTKGVQMALDLVREGGTRGFTQSRKAAKKERKETRSF